MRQLHWLYAVVLTRRFTSAAVRTAMAPSPVTCPYRSRSDSHHHHHTHTHTTHTHTLRTPHHTPATKQSKRAALKDIARRHMHLKVQAIQQLESTLELPDLGTEGWNVQLFRSIDSSE